MTSTISALIGSSHELNARAMASFTPSMMVLSLIIADSFKCRFHGKNRLASAGALSQVDFDFISDSLVTAKEVTTAGKIQIRKALTRSVAPATFTLGCWRYANNPVNRRR